MIAAGLVIVVALVSVVVRASRGDGVALQVLRALERTSTGSRREWLAAMLVEHDAIPDAARRRRFARGCMRAAIRRVGDADRCSGWVDATILLPVAASLVLVTYALVHHPTLRAGSGWPFALAVVAVGLAGCGLAGHHVGRLGSVRARTAGVLVAAPVVVLAAVATTTTGAASVGLAMAPALLPAVAATYALRREGDRDQALVAAATGALATALVAFATISATALVTHPGPDTAALADRLTGACVLLVVLPLTGLALGTLVAQWARIPPAARHDTTG